MSKTMPDMEACEQSSMLYWWPKIQDLAIPQPATTCVHVDDQNLRSALEGKADIEGLPEIKQAVEWYGLPVFLRGADTSGKHDWKRTCHLDDIKQLDQHVLNLAEDAIMKDVSTDAIFIRRFIQMRLAGFTAFYGDMPVSREVRCFINDGKKVCQHWYWFEDAVQNDGYEPKDPEWREKLKANNTLTEADQKTIDGYLQQVCKAFKDDWSVDFCQGADGAWWLIDMARASVSFHMDGCPTNE